MAGNGGVAIHAGRTEAEPAEVGYRPECIERLDAHFHRRGLGARIDQQPQGHRLVGD